jgi:hypothetical protein
VDKGKDASSVQGLGASDCKRGLPRDRRKSNTANCSTAICGWALRSILELAVCGVYKVQSCDRMCQGPVEGIQPTTLALEIPFVHAKIAVSHATYH